MPNVVGAVMSTLSRPSTEGEHKKEVSPTSAQSAQIKRSAGQNKKKAPKQQPEAPDTKSIQSNDTTNTHGLPVNGNFNLNQLIPETICDHCGKTFLMGVGVRKKEYAYKRSVSGRMQYYCSYACLCQSRRQKPDKEYTLRATKKEK